MNAARIEYHKIGLRCSTDSLAPGNIAAALNLLAESKAVNSNLQAMRRLFIEREQDNLTANACEAILQG